MITVKGTTKRGNQLLARAMVNEGTYLSDVYGSFSDAKYEAWKIWFNNFNNSNEPVYAFHICSHNTFGFSVAWFTDTNMHLVTPQNHYCVILTEDIVNKCLLTL